MPANLPPQYFEAEKKLRAAKNNADKVMVLEEMLAIMPKHKGTDKLRADLRHRIAKLIEAADKKSATQRASMLIEKVGAAQTAVIGLPNAGKSYLVSSITNASPSVAAYPFTTHNATPGMMEFENIQIQLIDTPPLTGDSTEWWLTNTIRRADGLLIVVDLSDAPVAQMENIEAQLGRMRIGLFERKAVAIQEQEEAPDIILHQKKALIIGNKIDQDNKGQKYQALQNKYDAQLTTIAISAKEGYGLAELKLKIYQMLGIIRVYTKAPGNKPDFNDPIILKKGSKLDDAAAEVHKDFTAKLKYARIWGSGKHDGLMAKRDHVLEDGDIIELHL
jgi:ribosome-interacting GTPase 1